jgi:hypothetical protein
VPLEWPEHPSRNEYTFPPVHPPDPVEYSVSTQTYPASTSQGPQSSAAKDEAHSQYSARWLMAYLTVSLSIYIYV